MWRLHAPSEGETKKGEYCTPSEGGRRWKEDKVYDERACGRGQAECDSATALNRGICCRCGNGTEGQGRTEGLWKGCRDESHAATAPNHGICCRCGNGTEGKRNEGAMGRKDNAAQKAYGKGAAMKAMPQRHRITEFAAVVGTGRKGNGTKGRWDERTRPYRRSMERMLR